LADLEQLVLSISADTRQMQRALARLIDDTKTAADSVDKAFGGATPKIDNVAKSLGKTRADTANLAAQFQDIAVQLQGGQSPFTIALQQGTQISQVLGQQGAGGAVGLLGTAFQSLLNPVSLGTIAIIALGGAAVQYISKATGGVGNLDDKLEAHDKLIRALKDAYGEAAKGVDLVAKKSAAVQQTLLGFSTADLQKDLRNLTNSLLASLTVFNQLGDAAGQFTEDNNPKFKAFQGAIDQLRESFKSGTPDIRGFQLAVSQVVDSSADQGIRKIGQELLESSKGAAEMEERVRGAARATGQLNLEALAAAKGAEEFKKALDKLGSTVTPDLDERAQIIKNYNDAMAKAQTTEDRLAAAVQRADQLAVLSANERKKAAEDAASEAEAAAKRFESAMNSAARQTAGIQGAIEGLGKGAGALAQFETQAKLTETAQQTLGKVTDETAAKIRAQAEAAGIAADALATAKLASQIDFANKTAFLSDDDVRIAQQLASIYGNDVTAALQSSYAVAIQLNGAFRSGSTALENDLTSGLTDIVSGSKSAKDGIADFAKSAVRDLEQLIIKLTVVGPLMRALQSGFGSLFGGSLPLPGDGAFIGPVARADGGPISGPGGPRGDQIPAMLSSGEFVVNAAATSRHRSTLEAINSGRAFASGGIVTPSLPLVHRGGGDTSTTVRTGDTNITIQGNADEKTVVMLRRELAARDAALPSQVVAAVKKAKQGRLL
jgi:tail length tape measure protein